MLRTLFFALGALFGCQVVCFPACEALDADTMHTTHARRTNLTYGTLYRDGTSQFPFICIQEFAFSYKSFMRLINHGLIPYLFSIAKRYSCAILSNASRKSNVSTHRRLSDTSACVTASRIMVTASMMELPGTLQNWLVRRCSSSTGRRRFASIRANSL